ncbi:MAG: hypothetical protein HWN79_10130 [Candidatus Lokiarchaeota archaeon]|nr:hypothetical protein [Candidatus Lokiarchaeota archaeon]
MEQINMRNSLKGVVELNFEDEQGLKDSVKTIRSEYIKKAFKSIVYITVISIVALSYFLYVYLPYIEKNFFTNLLTTETSNSEGNSFPLNLTLSWTLFSTSIFLIVYFVRLSQVKFTPSLIKYIERETKYAGFEFIKKIESVGLFMILTAISIAVLFYVDTRLIQFNDNSWSIMFQNSFYIYLLLSLILPIVFIFRHDKFTIKVKDNVFVLCNLHYNVRKNKDYDPNLLGMVLTSNRLCSRFDKSGKLIYSKISEDRWLIRIEPSTISPYLHFEEYSVPFNFQKQFLNIVLALNDWENNYSSNLDSMNYYFSNTFPFHKYGAKKEEKTDQLIYLKFLNQ